MLTDCLLKTTSCTNDFIKINEHGLSSVVIARVRLPFSIVNAKRHLLTTVVIRNWLKNRQRTNWSVISHSINWIRNEVGRQKYLYKSERNIGCNTIRLSHLSDVDLRWPRRYDILFINVVVGVYCFQHGKDSIELWRTVEEQLILYEFKRRASLYLYSSGHQGASNKFIRRPPSPVI